MTTDECAEELEKASQCMQDEVSCLWRMLVELWENSSSLEAASDVFKAHLKAEILLQHSNLRAYYTWSEREETTTTKVKTLEYTG